MPKHIRIFWVILLLILHTIVLQEILGNYPLFTKIQMYLILNIGALALTVMIPKTAQKYRYKSIAIAAFAAIAIFNLYIEFTHNLSLAIGLKISVIISFGYLTFLSVVNKRHAKKMAALQAKEA